MGGTARCAVSNVAWTGRDGPGAPVADSETERPRPLLAARSSCPIVEGFRENAFVAAELALRRLALRATDSATILRGGVVLNRCLVVPKAGPSSSPWSPPGLRLSGVTTVGIGRPPPPGEVARDARGSVCSDTGVWPLVKMLLSVRRRGAFPRYAAEFVFDCTLFDKSSETRAMTALPHSREAYLARRRGIGGIGIFDARVRLPHAHRGHGRRGTVGCGHAGMGPDTEALRERANMSRIITQARVRGPVLSCSAYNYREERVAKMVQPKEMVREKKR